MHKFTYKNTIIACYIGYITQAIGLNFTPILFTIFQEKFSLSFSELGSLIVMNFVTQIFTDIVSAKYVDRIGFRRAAVPSHILCALGLIFMFVLPSVLPDAYIALAIATIVYAIGGGMIEVVVSPIVDSLPSDDSSGAMSLLHSFYCWGQLGVVLLTTLALKIFGNDIWGVLALLWAVVPIVNVFNFLKVPLPETKPETKTPVRRLISNRFFLLAMLLMVAAGAAEQVIAQWSSLFAQTGLKVDKVVGDILGPSLFAVFMIIGRTYYGVKSDKLDLRKTLILSSILCVVCYLITSLSPSPIISLAGCALTGLSVSLMWPGMLSFASENFPNGGAAMFGVLAIFGDLGCSVGPMLTGIISDTAQKVPSVIGYASSLGLEIEQLTLKAGILSGIIFPVVMIVALMLFKDNKTK